MTTTFFDRPITGEISRFTDEAKEQKPAEEFLAALDGVLAFPEVEWVRWTQYTPYFNDGDACVFGACQLELKIKDVKGHYEICDTYPNGYWETHYNSQWKQGPHNGRTLPSSLDDRIIRAYGSPDNFDPTPELGAALLKLYDAIEDGHHDVTLNKTFGDPAQVTATKDGFHVEDYDHD